jgi:hypothetical protein
MPQCNNCGFYKSSKDDECSECDGQITFDPTLETTFSPSILEKKFGNSQRWQFIVAAPFLTVLCLYTYSINGIYANIIPIILLLGLSVTFISDVYYVSQNTDWDIDSNTWIVLNLICLVTMGLFYFIITPFYMYFRIKLTEITL